MSTAVAEQQQLLDSFADLGGEHDGRDDAYALDHAGALVAANPIASARVARYEEADR